jgi:hypothetical protein
MRISYENGKLYYSITKDEFAEINKDLRPTEIDIMWLPHYLKIFRMQTISIGERKIFWMK